MAYRTYNFLDGAPTVSKLNAITIVKTVPEMISFDMNDELHAVQAYNEGIKLAREVEDEGTVSLLQKILKMEGGHVDWAEMQQSQIEQMGLENYLAKQVAMPGSESPQ